jgi:hypothetical protein
MKRFAALCVLYALFLFVFLLAWARTQGQPPPPSGSTVATGTITILLGGQPIGSAPVLNFQPANTANQPSGIVMSCVPNSTLNSIDCTYTANTAYTPTIDRVHHNLNFLQSFNGTTAYTAKAAGTALLANQVGDAWLLEVATTCTSTCTLAIDTASGPITIKQADGVTSPNGTLIAGQARWIWFDGTIFRLL